MATAERARQASPAAIIAGLFLASLTIRPQLIAAGPLLPLIRADLGLPAGLAGFLTAIPILCMGVFAPVGPRLAARLGPRDALAASLCVISILAVVRSLLPDYASILASTFAIGIAMGIAGVLPAMIVAERIPSHPAVGTGAYAGGIVLGSTLTAMVAVPLAVNGEWRLSLGLLALVAVIPVIALVVLVPRTRAGGLRGVPARRLPWRSATAWLLLVIFGLQSVLYYGAVGWLPNVFVDRGWPAGQAASLVALVNATCLITTIGVPLVADRYGIRRLGLIVSAVIAGSAYAALALQPSVVYPAVAILGLAVGALFALSLTLPLDVADNVGSIGAVAALMLLGGYMISSIAPVILGLARDLTGTFDATLWLLVVVAFALTATSLLLTQARLRVRH